MPKLPAASNEVSDQTHAEGGDFPVSLTRVGSFYGEAQAHPQVLRSSTQALRRGTGQQSANRVLRRKVNGGKVFSKSADEC